jgi:hypothetical protein
MALQPQVDLGPASAATRSRLLSLPTLPRWCSDVSNAVEEVHASAYARVDLMAILVLIMYLDVRSRAERAGEAARRRALFVAKR